MDRAAVELDRRSRYLNGLIQQQRRRSGGSKGVAGGEGGKGDGEKTKAKSPGEEVAVVVEEQKEAATAAKDGVAGELPKEEKQRKGYGDGVGDVDPRAQRQGSVRVRAADMAPELQKRAFRCAQQVLAGMPRLDSKCVALTLKKEFDTSYGPAWHCIVGKSFGSYVTHSLGGFLYFSIDKVYILLFRTAVEPLEQ